jgi:hypothetical protein
MIAVKNACGATTTPGLCMVITSSFGTVVQTPRKSCADATRLEFAMCGLSPTQKVTIFACYLHFCDTYKIIVLALWIGMGATCSPEYTGHGCDRNVGAAAGWLTKGDFNRLYATTIFNVPETGQGALVATTRPVSGRAGALANGSNGHSEFFNLVAHTIGGQGVNPATWRPRPSNTAVFSKVFAGESNDASSLGLRNPDSFDFRPNSTSPLRNTGFIFPPYAPTVDGKPPSIGAYEFDDPDPWVPGCSLATCTEYIKP